MCGFDMDNILKEMAKERKVFSSESDFKFAMARKIYEIYKDNVDVIVEYGTGYESVVENKIRRIHIDLLVVLENKKIPIELKYRTKSTNINGKSVEFILANQWAHDNGCYGCARDICRISEFIRRTSEEQCSKGYVVFLTNDMFYTSETARKGSNYSGFWISKIDSFKDKEIEGIVDGNKRKLLMPGSFESSGWNRYSEIGSGINNVFKYNIITVTRKRKVDCEVK